MEKVEIRDLALDIASIYIGRTLFGYICRSLVRDEEFKRYITFSGAVRYANMMEE